MMSIRLHSVRLIFAAAMAATAAPTLAQEFQEGVIERLADPVIVSIPSSVPSGVLKPQNFHRSSRRFLRLHLTDIKGDSVGGNSVEFVDGVGAVVQQIDQAELIKRGSVWSGLIPGNEAIVRIRKRADAPGAALSFTISEIAYDEIAGDVRSVSGEDRRQEVYQYLAIDPSVVAHSKAVALLSFIRDRRLQACTGFLIADSLLLTNEHCVADQQTCDTTALYFGYLMDAYGRKAWEEQQTCRRVFTDPSRELDFSILEITGAPGRADRRGRLMPSNATIAANMHLLMLEHALGQPMQVSNIGCYIASASTTGNNPARQTDLGHLCDTWSGASGSPLLDDQNFVVGLHHLGFVDGTAWALQNRAVRVDVLRAELKRRCRANAANCIAGWSD